MDKYKFLGEYEVNASPRSIYPYLHNANSLSEWFIGPVKMEGTKQYNFMWDNTDHFAKLTVSRLNKQVKYEFLDENKQAEDNPNYLDIRLQQSELTDVTYINVTDYSEMTDDQDLQNLWEGLMSRLREVLGA
jgi:uncharacterized protein YndB with AHSA1/START domain